MSALPSTADMLRAAINVPYVPILDVSERDQQKSVWMSALDVAWPFPFA